jgi:hypothetical protein
MLGSWLMKARYQSIQTIADAVVGDCKNSERASEVQAIKHDPESQAALDPRDNLPISIRKYQESEVLLEQVGRLLRCDPRNQAELAYIERYYELCGMAFPESIFVRFLNVNARLQLNIGSLYYNQEQLFEISSHKDTSMALRYCIFRENMEDNQNAAGSNGKSDKLDLVSYVEIQKFSLQAEKHFDNSLQAILGFWYGSEAKLII